MHEADQTKFDRAIDEIIAGAMKLKMVTEGDQEGQQYQDTDETFCRITNGAFCLKMAYKIWQDIKTENIASRLAADQDSIPHAKVNWHPADRKMRIEPQGMSPEEMLFESQAVSPEEMLYASFQGLSPDEVEEFAKAYRTHYEAYQSNPDRPT